MWLAELAIGIIVLVATYFLYRVASPKDGVPPVFMRVPTMQTVIPFVILLGFCVSGTFIIYSLTAN